MWSSRVLAASLALAMGQLMVGQQYIQQGLKLVSNEAPGTGVQPRQGCAGSVALSADGNTARWQHSPRWRVP
ncbi:MAG: hypothetical protein ACLQOO_17340 [Terriglobia bacterium]